MGNKTTLAAAAAKLQAADDIHLYCHNDPDGDTTGSTLALYYGLKSLGKRVSVICRDAIPGKYRYMLKEYTGDCASPRFFAAVDTADLKLLSAEAGGIPFDLCIDHHPSNTLFAAEVLLCPEAPATAEVMYGLLCKLDVKITPLMANCLFTGLVTDTGCFRYSSVTAHTLRVAADLVDCGAQAYEINRRMFEMKTKSRLYIERAALDSLRFYADGRISVIRLSRDEIEQSGVAEWDLEGIASMTKTIEGVEIGIFLKEREDGAVKISLRTSLDYDASAICGQFGGGGHARAAGCTLTGMSLDEAAEKVVAAAEKELCR